MTELTVLKKSFLFFCAMGIQGKFCYVSLSKKILLMTAGAQSPGFFTSVFVSLRA